MRNRQMDRNADVIMLKGGKAAVSRRAGKGDADADCNEKMVL